MNLRPVVEGDLAAILELNTESVQFLSPLTPAQLAHLHRQTAYHKVIEMDGNVAAFLLAFREGADYDSRNLRWFEKHYPQFLYIDRIVVHPSFRGRGFAARLYDDVIAFAGASGVPLVTAEFYIEPPNLASQQLHVRYGFHEVGRQPYQGKIVSLQIKTLFAGQPAGPRPL